MLAKPAPERGLATSWQSTDKKLFGHDPVRANGSKLTGVDPHALKYSARQPASCGDKSGAAQSWAAPLAMKERDTRVGSVA
jgi:hypothetical protein